jgi:hypothetical protein
MKRGRVSYCGRCRTLPPRRSYSMARVADIVLLDH